MIELQRDDPVLNDAVLRRYPDAAALVGVCDHSTTLGRSSIREAHADGSLTPDVTENDLFCLLWLAGIASRDRTAPTGWQQVIERAIDAAWSAPN